MHVIATAGHVDHGKSTLVRALTGIEPDRWEEERRRGMTIDLGFAWTTLPSGAELAFVDVPGHERFVTNMLAGLGPVPAVMLVVAADSGWMPQTQEHVDALDALGVEHGLVVVSRCDLADPVAVVADVRTRLALTGLAGAPLLLVSAVTGVGMSDLRHALDALIARLPAPDVAAPIRLWVDRSFVIAGAGTVVTGTLSGGTLRVDDELSLNAGSTRVSVRGIHTLERPVKSVAPVARVALNLRGFDRRLIGRGDALTGVGPWSVTSVVDVLASADLDRVPSAGVLHIGSAAVSVRVRQLGGSVLRLSLARSLPLFVGDRALLRDPGQHRVVTGLRVLDVDPWTLRGGRAAGVRAGELAHESAVDRWNTELCRRRFIAVDDLPRLGLVACGTPAVPGWYVDPEVWVRLPVDAEAFVLDWVRDRPLQDGVPRAVLAQQLEVPAMSVLDAVIARTALRNEGGRVAAHARQHLPSHVEEAVVALEARWRISPFSAPDVPELRAMGLGPGELAAAERAGRLVVLERDLVLAPRILDTAAEVLKGLPGTFTLSQARLALGTSRRVAVPLLELMDRTGWTTRVTPELRKVVDRER